MILLRKLLGLFKPKLEPEHVETVDHDTVLQIEPDGTVIEWTRGDDDGA